MGAVEARPESRGSSLDLGAPTYGCGSEEGRDHEAVVGAIRRVVGLVGIHSFGASSADSAASCSGSANSSRAGDPGAQAEIVQFVIAEAF
jgi:hypothetical protein